MKTIDIIKIGLFTSMIVIGAFIKIPAPVIGVITLQLTFVLLGGIVLGSKNGAIAASVYAIGGLLGIPWFAYGGGPSYILQPSFGFILAFILGAYLAGLFREKNSSFISITIGSFIGTIVVWIIGMIYIWLILEVHVGKDIPFIPHILSIFSIAFVKDLVLAVIISIAGKRILNIVGEM